MEKDRKVQKSENERASERDGSIKGRDRERPGERHIGLGTHGQGLAEGHLTSSWPQSRGTWRLWQGPPWGGGSEADSGACSL